MDKHTLKISTDMNVAYYKQITLMSAEHKVTLAEKELLEVKLSQALKEIQ